MTRRAFVPIAGLHHAARGRTLRFCVFKRLRCVDRNPAPPGLRRVAYVDIDAHHGDCVYFGFAEDPDVLVPAISIDRGVMRSGINPVRSGDDRCVSVAAGHR